LGAFSTFPIKPFINFEDSKTLSNRQAAQITGERMLWAVAI